MTSSSGTLGNGKLRIGEEWGIRSALNTPFSHVLSCIPSLCGIWNGFSHWSCTTLQNGKLWLCGSECGIFDSSPFFIAGYRNRQSKKPAQLCLVTNLTGFFFLYFYFSSFWRERRRNFPVLRCGAAMFNFLQCWVLHGKSIIKNTVSLKVFSLIIKWWFL